MKFDPNWYRWIFASVAKHFNAIGELNEIHCHVEGFPRHTDELTEWFEVRMDGPYTKEHSDDAYELRVEINLGINVVVGPDVNAYRDKQIQGILTEGFVDNICIYKLGDTEEDDGSEIGYLEILTGFRERIVTSNFGVINAQTGINQSSIEAHYRINFDW
jgi:hypothetical protein